MKKNTYNFSVARIAMTNTSQESIVYGCIQDFPSGSKTEIVSRYNINLKAINELLPMEYSPLICQEMFTCTNDPITNASIIHFGMIYHGIEYEWNGWLNAFEDLLQKMYWCSVIVHLQTELKGHHTFNWESTELYHKPFSGFMALRGQWQSEGLHYGVC